MSEIKSVIPDFSGKCISITTVDGDDSSNVDIYNPVFEDQVGRIFLKGVSPKGSTESGWVEGCEVAIAWDRVSDYFIFESQDQFEKAAEVSRSFYEKKDTE